MATTPNPLDNAALVKELGGNPSTWDTFKSENFGPMSSVDDVQASNEDVLKKAYKQFTGREADTEGLAAHLKNPGGLEGGVRAIYGSQESQNFGRKDPNAWAGVAGAAPTTPPAAGGGTSTTMPVADPNAPVAAAGAAPAAPAGRRGSWGNLGLDAPTQKNINQFSGFNSERALAGADDDSVKDAFQRWAGGQDFDLRGKTKEQIGDFYKANLQNAKDYGLDIRDVQGEKILINTKERGPEWIDTVINAGGDPTKGENPSFGWQAEFDNIGNAALGGGGAPAQTTAAQNPALAQAIGGGGGATDPAAKDKILAEIEALIQGGASPMDNDALLQQLA